MRNVPPIVSTALDRERDLRGTSLNQTVLDLLAASLGVGAEPRENGLRSLSGDWTEDEHDQFEASTAGFRHVDEEMWR